MLPGEKPELTPIPSTRALIDLGAFCHNLSAVRAYVGPRVKILAVVKANAYGHGSVEMAREALRWGVDYLGVARVHEGVELRDAGVNEKILVFESVPGEQYEDAIKNGLELTVVSLESAMALDRAARRMGTTVPVHVKVDTGMGRLGLPSAGAVEAILQMKSLGGLDPVGIYSHFATSEDPDQSYALLQLDRFNAVVGQLSDRGMRFALRHMSNSGAIITLTASHLDMVRPGIMLYGYTPGQGMNQNHPVRPVMSLVSRVAFVKDVEAGTSISYGRRFTTTMRTQIATVPIGYADGYPRLLTNRASALIRGRRFPVVGTICMDHVMIDLGGDGSVREGDPVVFMGEDGPERITAWDIAGTIGTIPYEVTCLVTRRVPRVYLGR